VAREPIGPTRPLVRAKVVCVDCGVVFDPGKNGAPIRCEACRERHNATRPDRWANRAPVVCADCGITFQPQPKGSLLTLCPECAPVYIRRRAAEAARKRRSLSRSTSAPPTIDRSAARCIDCGGEVRRTTRGVPPQRCDECKREKLRLGKREYDTRVRASGLQPWRKPMACLDCGISIPALPGKRRNLRCDECRAKHRKPYQKDPVKNRDKHLRRMYGMVAADYDAMVEAQDGRCAICGVLPDPPQRLHVDHSHAAKRVRALLCGSCNRMIGLAHEDKHILAAAAKYLDSHQSGPE
jgi:DNA-directed RNA polymerase subunit RPC12/RpoP